MAELPRHQRHPAPPRERADLLQMEDFLHTVRAGDQPCVPLRGGVRSLLVALAAQLT